MSALIDSSFSEDLPGNGGELGRPVYQDGHRKNPVDFITAYS
jgi:hypothetical protein